MLFTLIPLRTPWQYFAARPADCMEHFGVEYFEEDLLRDLRRHVEDALEAGRLSYEESALLLRRLPLVAPVSNYRITSGFGKRSDPINRRWTNLISLLVCSRTRRTTTTD